MMNSNDIVCTRIKGKGGDTVFHVHNLIYYTISDIKPNLSREIWNGILRDQVILHILKSDNLVKEGLQGLYKQLMHYTNESEFVYKFIGAIYDIDDDKLKALTEESDPTHHPVDGIYDIPDPVSELQKIGIRNKRVYTSEQIIHALSEYLEEEPGIKIALQNLQNDPNIDKEYLEKFLVNINNTIDKFQQKLQNVIFCSLTLKGNYPKTTSSSEDLDNNTETKIILESSDKDK